VFFGLLRFARNDGKGRISVLFAMTKEGACSFIKECKNVEYDLDCYNDGIVLLKITRKHENGKRMYYFISVFLAMMEKWALYKNPLCR
jgi:hypothetical protein